MLGSIRFSYTDLLREGSTQTLTRVLSERLDQLPPEDIHRCPPPHCPTTNLSVILVSRASSSLLDKPPDLRITPILLLQTPIQGILAQLAWSWRRIYRSTRKTSSLAMQYKFLRYTDRYTYADNLFFLSLPNMHCFLLRTKSKINHQVILILTLKLIFRHTASFQGYP